MQILRKLDAPVASDPSKLASDKKGKEKSTKPQSWQEVKIDGKDEVRIFITRFLLGYWPLSFLYREVGGCLSSLH